MNFKGHFFLAGAVMLSASLSVPADSHGTVLPEDAGKVRIQMQHASPPQMAGAVFDHQKHYASVKKDGGDCTACHTVLGKASADGTSKFQIIAEKGSQESMKNAWHAFCADCHKKHEATPPAASCRTCHDDLATVPGKLPVQFDRSLHAKHVDSRHIAAVTPEASPAAMGELKNCGACHASVTEDGKKVYIRGTEDSSTFFGTASSDPAALSAAAHERCVACHVDVMKNGGANAAALSLPVECSACHSSKGQALFPSVSSAPRLFRGQSDIIEMGKKEATAAKGYDLDPAKAVKTVPFNHKLHEEAASCKTCHGMVIDKDKIKNKDKAAFMAAHDPADPASCVGCHASTAKADKNCAGCHADMPAGGADSCAVCHRNSGDMTQNAQAKVVHQPIDPRSIPEKVTIGSLSREYEPVVLPHRKIYEVLLKGVKGNALSDAFHAQSMCLACHHHTPGDSISNPPTCSTCHDKSISAAKATQAPYLKTAYHQMCIGCHSSMDVKPVALDCAGCHAPVKKDGKQKTKREVR